MYLDKFYDSWIKIVFKIQYRPVFQLILKHEENLLVQFC